MTLPRKRSRGRLALRLERAKLFLAQFCKSRGLGVSGSLSWWPTLWRMGCGRLAATGRGCYGRRLGGSFLFLVLTGGLGAEADDLPREVVLSDEVELEQAADAILEQFREAGYPAVDVTAEENEAGERVIKSEVLPFAGLDVEGTSSRVKMAAGRFFEDLVGEEIYMPELKRRLERFHRSPMHVAWVGLNQSPGAENASGVSLVLNVEESVPWVGRISAANDLPNPLPRGRVGVGFDWADLGGVSGITTLELGAAAPVSAFHYLRGSQRWLLPDGREWQVGLAYSGSEVASVAGLSEAWSGRVDAGHWWEWTGEKSGDYGRWRPFLGMAFRRANNAVFFGGGSQGAIASTLQLEGAARWEREWDRTGSVRVLGRVLGSVVGEQDDYEQLRRGAEPRHLLGRLQVAGRYRLTKSWQLQGLFLAQWATDPVLQADQMPLGGVGGVRGLPELSLLVDSGVIGRMTVERDLPIMQEIHQTIGCFFDVGSGWDLALRESRSVASLGGQWAGQWQGFEGKIELAHRLDASDHAVHFRLVHRF